MTARRTLLFVSPIMPRRSGNGLAMRAGLVLEGLARQFEVHLLVLPASGGSLDVPDVVRALAARVGVLDLHDCIDTHAALIGRIDDETERRRHRAAYPRPWAARFSGAAAAMKAMEFLAGTRIDVLHVMRLYLAPLAPLILHALPAPAPLAILDLDDDDVRTHERLAGLHDLRGEAAEAELDRAEAAKYAACASELLGHFSAVLTASRDDAQRLSALHAGARFDVVPNGYAEIPRQAGSAGPRTEGHPVRLLFVANLGYVPNADAAELLALEILPTLRHRGVDARLDIVGGGTPDDLRAALARAGEGHVALHGWVDSVAACYAAADIAVVPLRAGGGTRIKILEAFAYGVPVVTSTLGAEGLDAVFGTHLLCADTPEEFAGACQRLAADPALAASLAADASELHRLHYTPGRVHAKMAAIISNLFEGR
ncbi:MAG: glycosyltransferase [Xanthobacteraceae bacterium]|nr:glycosyltransferase [Xanthobacteraceae bacterium]